MILGLDLSTKCTGWSKFSKSGALIDRGRIIPAEDINVYQKIQYVVDNVKQLYKTIDEIVIEDIYLPYGSKQNPQGLFVLARLSGAIIYSWMSYKYKLPNLYTATRARKLVGINGRAQKAEVQLWAIKKYKWATKDDIYEWECQIESLNGQKKAKELTSSKFKYRMEKISKIIEEATEIGEDMADALVVSLAYLNDEGVING